MLEHCHRSLIGLHFLEGITHHRDQQVQPAQSACSAEPTNEHAGGHDSHVAMLAMALKLLAGRRDTLQGNVAFMFQPGEEGYGGAKIMLDEGLLDVPPAPQAAVALHIFPNLPTVVIATRPGPMLAAADWFNI